MSEEYFTKCIGRSQNVDMQIAFCVHACTLCNKEKLGIYVDNLVKMKLYKVHICLDCITKEKIIYDLQRSTKERKKWLGNLKVGTSVSVVSAFSHEKIMDSKIAYKNSSTLVIDMDGVFEDLNVESGYTTSQKHRNLYYIDSCRKG